jgi:hypothetical protein
MVLHPALANKLKEIKYPGADNTSSYEEVCRMFWNDTQRTFGFLLNTPQLRGQRISWAEFAELITRYSVNEKALLIAEVIRFADGFTAITE